MLLVGGKVHEGRKRFSKQYFENTGKYHCTFFKNKFQETGTLTINGHLMDQQ